MSPRVGSRSVALAERHLAATLFLAIGVGAAVLGLLAYAADALAPLEQSTVDRRFELRGAQQPDDLLLVAIDAPSLEATGWPIPHRSHARAIRRIDAGGPRVIAYAVVFVDERPGSNELVAATASTGGKVALPATDWGPDGSTGVFGGGVGPTNGRAAVGSSVLGQDGNAVVRRFRHTNDGLEAWEVKAAELALGRPIAAPHVGADGAWIDFRGPPGTIESVSFADVLQNRVPPARFRGKVVVVGSAERSVQPPFATPTTDRGDLMWGVEVTANAVWTALHGFPLRSAGWPVDAAAIVLLALAVPLAGLGLALRWALLLAVVLAAGYAAAAQLAFERGRVVAVAYPLAALVLATVGTVGAKYVLAAFDRRRVRDEFRRFVPEQVVDELLARTDGRLSLGARELEGTVMFTDVRDFTSFSETRPAGEVIAVLNRYLGEMTDGVLEHGGTVVSYTGDGFMAVFGAPLEQEDHADRALAAARELLDVRLPRFNEWLARTDGARPFRMGIGLHSGAFASGNVGSERRLEYTAIGDTINTASRLESLTKESGSSLLVSSETRAALLRGAGDLVYVAELEVRGRRGRVRAWSPAGGVTRSVRAVGSADERT